jgi:hypothetical protein
MSGATMLKNLKVLSGSSQTTDLILKNPNMRSIIW